jgi:hypothetical protein
VNVSRYLVPFIALTTAVSLVWCRERSALCRGYRLVLLLYPLYGAFYFARHGFADWEVRELLIAGAMLALLSLLVRSAFGRGRALGLAALLLAWMWSSAALQTRRDETRSLAMAESAGLHGLPRYWTEAAAAVDGGNQPHRIAITGGSAQRVDNWFSYFFYGKRFDNRLTYVPITADGAIVHFGPDKAWIRQSHRSSWLARLSERKIDLVMTFAPHSLEQQWMDGTPERFRRLYGDLHWGLYAVLP